MKPLKMPSLDELRQALNYDPATGLLHWRQPAGALTNGYLRVGFKGRQYKAHRLAFYLHHGREPVGEIDHINGDRTDNRIENLRETTRAQNGKNLKARDGKTKGVQFRADRKSRPYQARITVDGKFHHLGCHETLAQAQEAYDSAARRLFGPYAREMLSGIHRAMAEDGEVK